MSGSKPNASYANLQLWLDASTLPIATTSVSTWADSSNKGNDATQGSSGFQPTYVPEDAVLSGRPSVSFDGTDDRMTSALASTMGIDGSSPRTIFVVYHQDTLAAKNVVGYGAQAAAQLFDVLLSSQEFAGHFYGAGNDTLTETTQTYPLSSLVVGTISYDGTDVNTYQHDGSFNGSLATKTIALTTGDSAFNIGAGSYTPLNYFNGTLAEVLVYSEALSTSDREAVDNYLFTKYTTSPPGIPEPGTGLLAACGLLLAVGWRRRASGRAAGANRPGGCRT